MSTHNTQIDRDQEAPPQTPGSFYGEDTLQRVQPPPTGNFPPPRRPSPRRSNYWFAVAAVVVVVALIFSVFALVVSLQGQHPGTQATPTPTAPQTTVTTAPGGQTTPTPTQGGTQQPTPVNSPAYWDGILGTAGTNGKVENVSLAHILGTSSLQALVTVRHSDANRTLDVYVFDRITSAKPTQLFNLSGLIKGDAQISGYNSVMTAQVDTHSALNSGKPAAQWTPDLFREFAWNGTALAQVAFPGLFPDLTRYQAEADQAQVDKGHDPWKNDPIQVAKALEARFFGWQRAVTAKILSGGGPQDVSATVQVQEASVQGSNPTIVVTLSRLEGATHNMWIATGVADGSSLTLKNLAPRQLISSPVTLEGTGAAFEAVIGQAMVYDHLYTTIGHAQITGSNGMGMGTFTTPVSYSTSFTGIQEGIVAVYQNNGGLSAEYATGVMMKVLLSPAHQSLTVSSVDLTVSPSSITGISCGSTTTLIYTATFHLQSTANGGTIQFLYTWNNGRASPSGSVTVPPNGPNTATFTYMATGRVGGAYAFPGVAQVNVTSPNTVQSNQVIPTGACSTSTQPTADAAPTLVPFNGTAYVGWTGMNPAHNLALATYDTTNKVFGPATVLTDTTRAGTGPSLEVFNGNLYVAWLGTDGHLNVARYNPANPTQLAGKVTLSETSNNAPSLAAFNGRLYLSWRGMDGNLNLISSADASHFDTKVTYHIAVRTSPTLVSTPFYLFVGWEDTSANSYITIGRYDPSNPANMSVVVTTSSSQLPIGLTFAGNAGYPGLRVAWRTASDAHIQLGLFGGASVLQGIVTTAQTTIYGPALTVAGHGGPFLSWTGTDAAQTVNVSPVNI
jgi:hypothetical protein